MILDFKEIPEANTGSGLQDTFELFTRDFLAYLGYRIIQDPDRGADGKKDLIVEEVIKGITSEYTIRWLVSCKHYAHSGAAVKDSNEINISDRIKQHDCDGFMGVYSTLAAVSLSGLLNGQKHSIIFDREKIESRLLENIDGHKIAARFFPISFSNYKFENPIPAQIFSDNEPILCERCNKNLLLDTEHGNYVCVKLPPEYDDEGNNIQPDQTIKDIYFSCKDCGHFLEREYYDLGYSDAGWEDIDDICIPTIWLLRFMAFVNGIHKDQSLDDKAFDVMKQLFIRTYPYVARHQTTKEKERVSTLMQFEQLFN